MSEAKELQERIANVLTEHFFHNAEFTGEPGIRWAIECNCDEIITANSHPEAEGAFTRHQAEALYNIFLAGQGT
jgi:hypothetical protein